MSDNNVREEVYFRYNLSNNEIDEFHDNISISVDITHKEPIEQLVSICNHFLRFISAVGFDVDDVIEVMTSLKESAEELEKEILEEEDDFEN